MSDELGDLETNSAPRDPSAYSDLPIEGKLVPHQRLVVMAGVSALLLVWFAYDGWWNSDPEMLKHTTFNRVGTAVLFVATGIYLLLTSKVRAAVERGVSSGWALIFLSPDGESRRVATVPWLWGLQFGGWSLLFHKRPILGVLLGILDRVTYGLSGLVLAFFIGRVIRKAYEEDGWRELTG